MVKNINFQFSDSILDEINQAIFEIKIAGENDKNLIEHPLFTKSLDHALLLIKHMLCDGTLTMSVRYQSETSIVVDILLDRKYRIVVLSDLSVSLMTILPSHDLPEHVSEHTSPVSVELKEALIDELNKSPVPRFTVIRI